MYLQDIVSKEIHIKSAQLSGGANYIYFTSRTRYSTVSNGHMRAHSLQAGWFYMLWEPGAE